MGMRPLTYTRGRSPPRDRCSPAGEAVLKHCSPPSGLRDKIRVCHHTRIPQNLILMGLTPEEGVKLVDFGLSRIIHEDTELTHIMGTPDYVAPEIINFEPVGLATDMSIGVLTYVLLSGYTPFGGDTDQETFVNITQGDFDFPEEYFSNVTHQAKDFISGLLLKSPNQRLTVDQCFSHPWLSDLIDLHRYSNLSEADSADSGYSTDLCSGSPPSPGMISNGFVSTDLSQYSIPEHRQISSTPTARRSLSKQYPTIQLPRVGESDMLTNGSSDQRKPRLSTAHMSVNVLDCLQGQQQRSQCKSLRRSSLVIPRHTNDLDTSKMQDPFCLYDENQNKSRSMYLSDNFLSSPSKKKEKDSVKNPFDDNINLARPWNNLCCGSYSRALNQLTSPTPKKNKQRTNLGIRPELSCSMFELKPKL
ncbi:Serine/threonine-protein kinase 17A [Armadillidium vulgare]|nr:Serine/threonine-protein kinase 17A [Armadillidium vulgare]